MADACSDLSSLPTEILENMLKRLDFDSLRCLFKTSRLFANLASDPKLWKRFLVESNIGMYSRDHLTPSLFAILTDPNNPKEVKIPLPFGGHLAGMCLMYLFVKSF